MNCERPHDSCESCDTTICDECAPILGGCDHGNTLCEECDTETCPLCGIEKAEEMALEALTDGRLA